MGYALARNAMLRGAEKLGVPVAGSGVILPLAVVLSLPVGLFGASPSLRYDTTRLEMPSAWNTGTARRVSDLVVPRPCTCTTQRS